MRRLCFAFGAVSVISVPAGSGTSPPIFRVLGCAKNGRPGVTGNAWSISSACRSAGNSRARETDTSSLIFCVSGCFLGKDWAFSVRGGTRPGRSQQIDRGRGSARGRHNSEEDQSPILSFSLSLSLSKLTLSWSVETAAGLDVALTHHVRNCAPSATHTEFERPATVCRRESHVEDIGTGRSTYRRRNDNNIASKRQAGFS